MRAPLILLAIFSVATPALGDIYKYTDEHGVVTYTNMPGRAPTKAERIAVEPSTPQPTQPTVTIPGPNRAKPATPSPAGFPRVDGDTQRKRDDARRQILETELNGERKALDDAKVALSSGQEVRLGNEKNYQKYLDRVKDLQDSVNTHQSNVDALQRELSNLH